MEEKQTKQIPVRVVIIGDSQVGKTALITRYLRETFIEKEATIGVSIFSKVIKDDYDNSIVISFCDTAGQEKYRSLGSLYYRNASLALIVFDVTKPETFDSLKSWIEEYIVASGGSRLIIVGNKIDLGEQIDYDQAVELASAYNSDYVQTSAKTGQGINELFSMVIDKIKNFAAEDSVSSIPPPVPPKKESSCC